QCSCTEELIAEGVGASDIESAVAGIRDNSDFVLAINEEIRESIAGKIGVIDIKANGTIRPFRPGKLGIHRGWQHKTAQKQKSKGDAHSCGYSGGPKNLD
ncbi:MAG TPA: hypothetical protein VIW67_03770, partial [Terriglobales bacterium]